VRADIGFLAGMGTAVYLHVALFREYLAAAWELALVAEPREVGVARA
jgi:hypothetical protein